MKEERRLRVKGPLVISMMETMCPYMRSPQQWDQIATFVKVMKPLFEATTASSGEKFASLSKIIPIVYGVRTSLEFLEQDGDIYRRRLATKRFQKISLLKRFPNDLMDKDLYVISMVLILKFKDVLLTNAQSASIRDEILKLMIGEGEVCEVSPRNNSNAANESFSSIWDAVNQVVRQKRMRIETSENDFRNKASDELDRYLRQPPDSSTEELQFWKKNQVQFPALANLALEYLSIPGTAVPSERVWSDGGNIISSGRQSISPANFRMLIFLKENLLKQ